MKKFIIPFLALALFLPVAQAQNTQSVSLGFERNNQHKNEVARLKNEITDLKNQMDVLLADYSGQISTNESDVAVLESIMASISNTINGKVEELKWIRMPLDSLCGFYSDDNGTGNLCMGHNPHFSCPDGFERAQVYYESGGTNRSTFCVKTRHAVEDVSWEKMPSGSMCGFSSTSHGGGQVSRVDCLGHNPLNTCPPDFRRVAIYMESSGDGYLGYCMKL